MLEQLGDTGDDRQTSTDTRRPRSRPPTRHDDLDRDDDRREGEDDPATEDDAGRRPGADQTETPPRRRRAAGRQRNPGGGQTEAAARPRAAAIGRGAEAMSGDDLRPLRARRPPRLGRDVDRLPGDRPDPRAHGRGEDPRRAPLRRRALRRPLPPRGAGGREADPPQHRPGLRHRRRRRPPLHRHGVRRGQLGRAAAAAPGPARRRDRGRDRRPGLRRPRLRAPPGDHPPRRQARAT